MIVVGTTSRGQGVQEIGNTEETRQLKKTTIVSRLRHRNFAAVHLRKLIGLNPGNVTFNEVNAKRQCQDRDYDHEPVAMFAENSKHGMGGQFTSGRNSANYFL